MHILKADGTTEEFNDNSLDGLQKAVGGYIQIIPTLDGKIMVLNEEGKMNDLPYNKKATEMANIFPNDYIVGDVVIAEENEID
jgi:hypothetical protein